MFYFFKLYVSINSYEGGYVNIEAIHISVDGLRVNGDISNLLDKYQIKTYADLEKCIYNYEEISNNYFLTKAYFDLKNEILNQQLSAKTVYDEYISINSKKEHQNINVSNIDRQVRIIDLPLYASQPNLIYRAVCGRYRKCYSISNLDRYSVEDLKIKMNEFVVKNGETYLALTYYNTGIGEIKYTQLLATIKFYDEYIRYLLEKYPNIENPFYHLQSEKVKIVKDNRKEIFNYLNETGYEFVFGPIDKIMQIVNGEISSSRLLNRLDLIENVIANYITFDDALNITSPKVLKRFIVPYGKK